MFLLVINLNLILKLNLLINLIKIKFVNKFNLDLFKFKIRNLNSKLKNYLNYKKDIIKKYKFLGNLNEIISIFYYSSILKNLNLVFFYIYNLFSFKFKNHYKSFNVICNVISILFKLNIINLKGFKLKIKGKINGKMRKKKLIFSLGNLNFSKFNQKIDFLFLSKLTIFGSLGFKL